MTTAVKIDAVFGRCRRTAAKDPELRELSQSLSKRALADSLGYFFVDDEAAMHLLCAAYGGHGQRPRLAGTGIDSRRLREFEWCALYPLPVAAFASVARRYGPGARNVIILGTGPRPTDPAAGVDSELSPWQLEETTIYLGEKVIVFPTATGSAAESPKDVTEVYLQQGLAGVLAAAGQPPLEVIFFNPRQKDLLSYQNGRLLERVLAGTFAA